MSTAYRVRPRLAFQHLLDNPPKGVVVRKRPDGTTDLECGGNFVNVYPTSDGEDTGLEKFGTNDVTEILRGLRDKFGVQIFSEHDEGFWDPAEEAQFELEAYQEEWDSLAADSGLEECKAGFRRCLERCRFLGVPVPETYPDGSPLES